MADPHLKADALSTNLEDVLQVEEIKHTTQYQSSPRVEPRLQKGRSVDEDHMAGKPFMFICYRQFCR